MKKTATTLMELLTAMVLMVALTVVSITSLRVFVAKDTDIVKFKHLYGSVSAAVYELINDIIMYPSGGFANTTATHYYEETKEYGGKDKFKKLFKSKFNIFHNNIDIDFGVDVPLAYKKTTITSDPQKETFEFTVSKKVSCFIENKGFTYCPPETPEYYHKNKTIEQLESIYLPVFVSKIDTKTVDSIKKSATLDKAIFIKIDNDGKIEIPLIVKNNKNEVINCTKRSFNSYSHCKVIEKMEDMDF